MLPSAKLFSWEIKTTHRKRCLYFYENELKHVNKSYYFSKNIPVNFLSNCINEINFTVLLRLPSDPCGVMVLRLRASLGSRV